MAQVQTFTLPHYEAYPVHIALFTDVKNAEYLRSQLLAANPDFDYAFIDAAMILTLPHLLSATFLALHTTLSPNLTPKTRTPHSELIFRLSPTNNIGESYKTFGIGPSTQTLICVKLPIRGDGSVDGAVSAESVGEHLGDVVEGVSVDVGEVGRACDVHRVKKVYKVGCAKGGKKEKKGVNGDAGRKDDRGDIESVVLGAMALKGS